MGPDPTSDRDAPDECVSKASADSSNDLLPESILPMLDRIRVLIPLRRHLSLLAGGNRQADHDCPEPEPETQSQRTSDDGSESEDITASAHARRMLIGHPLPRPCSPARSTLLSNRQLELLNYLTSPSPSSPMPLLPHATPLLSVLPSLSPPTRTAFGPLVLNSQWTGKQFSEEKSYNVHVKVIHLDLDNGAGSGVLDIKGLTEEWPTMTTFFDIEVIGPHHDFLTNAWHSSENCDYDHWSKFPSFSTYIAHLQSSIDRHGNGQKIIDLDDPEDRLKVLRNSTWNHHHQSSGDVEIGSRRESDEWWLEQPFLFMRWKERFLVNDYKKQEIDGASFAGFYYVCLQIPQSNHEEVKNKDQDDIMIQESRPEDDIRDGGAKCPGSPSSSTGSTSPSWSRRDSTPPPLDTALADGHLRGARDASCPVDADRLASSEDEPLGLRPREAGEDEKIQTLVSGSGRTEELLVVKPRPETQPVAKQTPAGSTTANVEESSWLDGGGGARDVGKRKWGWEEAMIQGFYYHPKSEPYQELVLQFDDCFGQGVGLDDGSSCVDHGADGGNNHGGGGESARRSGFGSATYQIS